VDVLVKLPTLLLLVVWSLLLQWCGIGFSQLPNGIGFGGQVGHYGLYIDSTMDQGMSRSAATYARWVQRQQIAVYGMDTCMMFC
jgi:hypothetical protein